MNALLDTSATRIVNVYGMDGIGKTRFVSEVAYYLSARFKYREGVFLFDFRKSKYVE